MEVDVQLKMSQFDNGWKLFKDFSRGNKGKRGENVPRR